MKIILFIASDEWGGAEDSFVSIANEISKSHQVIALLVRGNMIGSRFSERVDVRVVDRNPSRVNLFLYTQLIDLINREKPDLIHTHGGKATKLIYAIKRFTSTVQVATKHNSRKGAVFNKIKYITAVSEAVAESVTHGNAEIIFNGITPKNVERHQTDIFTIRAIGRLEKVKSYDALVSAVAKLDFPFNLEIVGEGSERKRLEQIVDENNLTSKVRLAGFKDNIAQLICDADLVVINSETEGFSLVLIEALFYAEVLISTPVGGSTEVLDDRFLFNPKELSKKIADVYENHEQYKKEFSEIKAVHKKKFEIANVAKRYIEYYQAALQS